MKASGSMGYGLIKTISNSNKFYCLEDNCTYYVTIILEGVNFFNFFPTILPNGSELKFNNFLQIIEELEKNEDVTYELTVPKIKGDWVFTLMPTEGNV